MKPRYAIAYSVSLGLTSTGGAVTVAGEAANSEKLKAIGMGMIVSGATVGLVAAGIEGSEKKPKYAHVPEQIFQGEKHEYQGHDVKG